MNKKVSESDVDTLYARLDREAEKGGYHLNPNVEFTKELVKGLKVNEKRYGYRACPCRLADGNKINDLDIICPCDYRDQDITEYGTCYCGLYVSQKAVDGEKEIDAIPERRPDDKQKRAQFQKPAKRKIAGEEKLLFPIWRCRVCGYLCARDKPPEVCPVCFAKRDRFENYLQ